MRVRTVIVHPIFGEITGAWSEGNATKEEIDKGVDFLTQDLKYLVLDTKSGKTIFKKDVLLQSVIRVEIEK